MSSRLFESFPKLLLPGVVLPLLLQACGGVDSSVPDGEFVPPVVEFQLVFEDNFDGDTLDASKWNIDEGDGCPDLCGWGNNELQVYSADNVSVSNGLLRIEGRREADGTYTSGRLNTQGKFDFRYGRIEVSARIPSGQGTWPAIWLLHSDPTVYGPWPLSGEIDIMEAFNYGVDDNQETRSTTHYGLPTPPFNGTGSGTDLALNADMNFHEYALEWERGRIRFFIDGQHFQTQIVDEYWVYYPAGEDGLYDPFGPYTLGLEDAPFDQAFHLLLNFAIGGDPVGPPDDSVPFEKAMEIDYVRVYECANSNPESRRGCGTADASVEVLSDHDGGPLEGANTAKPYVESVELFLDGPETITLEVGEESGSNTLSVDGFTGDGAVVTSNPGATDPDDPENIVWQVSVSGGVANVFLASQDLADDELLDTGFDFSGSDVLGGDPVGEVVFDMYVNSVSDDATILIKLDSGVPEGADVPNVGEVVLPLSEVVVGDWKTYSIKFEDLVANPGFEDFGGEGVDLENVVNPFVFEVTSGSVDVLLDNIMVTNACYVVGACSASLRTKGIPDLIVFDDAVNTVTWSRGIAASDSGSGFVDYSDGTNPANKVNWAIIADEDPERGQVIDVTFNDSSAFGVWFIADATGVDTSAFAAGAVVFDIIVDDYGSNTDGITMKIDCFFDTGCSSFDKPLGVIGDGVWETVTFPVSSLTATGLDLTRVNTGLVIFPTTQNNVGTTRFRLDNIRWVASTDAIPLEQINLPVTFDNPLVDYTLTDFGGTASAVVDDPTGADNQVAQTTHNGGPFAGTVIGTDAGFASPIPFTAVDTQMSIRVYSPAAGVPIMLKVENSADGSIFAESMPVLTTVANDWETLVFDFAGLIDPDTQTYDKAVLFFNFPNAGDGAVYYWDDVAAVPGLSQIDLPVTFEDPTVDYSLSDFEGTSSVLVADPTDATNTVAATTKGDGAQFFAGTIVGRDFGGFANPIPFTVTDTEMTVRVLSPAAGINVRLKVENAADANIFAEVDVLTTVANDWETMRFDFAGAPGFDPNLEYSKAIIFFDFVVDKPGDGSVYYWDDLALGDLIQPIDLPVTFDEPFVDYTLSDFEGAATVLEGDPTGVDNTVRRYRDRTGLRRLREPDPVHGDGDGDVGEGLLACGGHPGPAEGREFG
jgi:beta-glucanase (GH16 family)